MAGNEQRSWAHVRLHNDGLFLNLEHGDIVCVRNEEVGAHRGDVRCNIAQRIVHHSPSGFEWAYAGSGPAELALNILDLYLPPNWRCPSSRQRTRGVVKVASGKNVSDEAWNLHQEFKRRFVEPLPYVGGVIPGWAIRRFLRANGVAWHAGIWHRGDAGDAGDAGDETNG